VTFSSGRQPESAEMLGFQRAPSARADWDHLNCCVAAGLSHQDAGGSGREQVTSRSQREMMSWAAIDAVDTQRRRNSS